MKHSQRIRFDEQARKRRRKKDAQKRNVFVFYFRGMKRMATSANTNHAKIYGAVIL